MAWDAWFSLSLGVVALLLMSIARYEPHWVMMGLLILLSASGIIDAETALSGFSNAGVITVAALFVVAAGVNHSGGIDMVNRHLLGQPRNVTSAQSRIIFPVALLSGFLNNTPVVATMIPALHLWSRKIGISTSKLMIPLSYAAVLGGTLTLIGTSTNLVVNSQYQLLTGDSGFSIFSITKVGLPVTLAGLAFMLFYLPRILPDRKDEQKFGSVREFTLEVTVEPGGPLTGKTITEAGLRALDQLYLVEIEREDGVIAAVPSEEKLRGGDRLVFAGDTRSASDLLRIKGLIPSSHEDEPSLSVERAERRLVEAALSPHSDVIGMTIRDAHFRERYGAVVLAIARGGERVPGNLGNIVLKSGDVLLLEARPAFVTRQRSERDFLLINDLDTETPRHHRAYLAWSILVGLVAAVATGIVGMLNAALIGAALMVLTGCCSVEQAQKNIDIPVLLTIAASFALGGALVTTGAAAYLGMEIVSLSNGTPLMVLILVYAAVSLLTEMITNNAAAIVILPVILSMAEAAGMPAEPLVITVMMAASASFATPLGYQTNMMVYGPGSYQFTDYLKAGIPMNILIGITSITVIAVVYNIGL